MGFLIARYRNDLEVTKFDAEAFLNIRNGTKTIRSNIPVSTPFTILFATTFIMLFSLWLVTLKCFTLCYAWQHYESALSTMYVCLQSNRRIKCVLHHTTSTITAVATTTVCILYIYFICLMNFAGSEKKMGISIEIYPYHQFIICIMAFYITSIHINDQQKQQQQQKNATEMTHAFI